MTASLKLVYRAVRGEFAQAMAAMYNPIATASTLAVKDVATQIKNEGRSRIAAAGFSRRWQNALRVNVYPSRGVSANAAALAYHKIPYAGVFETGATITGSPLLWIPLPGIPLRIAGRRMTPRVFVETIGPLHSINIPGKPPMLAAYISIGASSTKLTVAKLKAGTKRRSQKGLSAVKSVPVFYGISTVQLKAKFGLTSVFERGRASLGQFYLNHIRNAR